MTDSIINTPDQHGFIMAGTTKLYICHLPMFNMQNHMYQVTLEVTIPKEAFDTYLADKEAHPEAVYVLGNLQTDLFTIPDVILDKTTLFMADIFRGVPEDPNTETPLIHNIETRITRVVYARHFDYGITYPDDLTYVVFGNEREAFIDHYLTSDKDFLNIISLAKVPSWLPIDLLEISSNVGFIDYKSTPMPTSSPLVEKTYDVTFQGQNELFELEVGKQLFFDTEIVNMSAMEIVNN
jgi:hypothetical protein